MARCLIDLPLSGSSCRFERITAAIIRSINAFLCPPASASDLDADWDIVIKMNAPTSKHIISLGIKRLHPRNSVVGLPWKPNPSC
jgi:hypothetical protein